MNEEINKRVMNLLEAYGYTKSQFALELGISLSIVTHISTGRNKPGLELIQKVLTHFKDLNPDWLLLGEGEMKREKPKNIDITSELADLKVVSTELTGLQDGINQTLNYHKILYDEIMHLRTLSQNLLEIGKKQNQLSERLKEIEIDIISKMEH